MSNSQVDIIIPVYDQELLTKGCIESIRKRSDMYYRLILIDNASGEATRRMLEAEAASDPNIMLIRNAENLGWVKAVNQGIKASSAQYICIMNNDTVVHTDKWLSALTKVASSEKDIGLVNPRFDIKKSPAMSGPYIEIDFCRGYCVLIKREVIDKIGGLDEAYGLGYYDDDDLSVRAILAGYRCVRVEDVYVEHLRDTTFKAVFDDQKRRALHEKNKQLFYAKWGRRLKVLFIVTRADMVEGALERALFAIARKQHIVYLWRKEEPMDMPHINIREFQFPPVFTGFFYEKALGYNTKKRQEKRYDIVITDDEKLCAKLSAIRNNVYYARLDNDLDRIEMLAKEASRI